MPEIKRPKPMAVQAAERAKSLRENPDKLHEAKPLIGCGVPPHLWKSGLELASPKRQRLNRS